MDLEHEIAMKILPDVALTYDDVLLVPQYSNVASCRRLSTQTRLTRRISLQAPVISANMDTVTESQMAITMARQGGIGIIHRFMTIDEQVRQIEHVKKSESHIVENPITLTVSHTVGDVKKIVKETYTGGILVLDGAGCLVGIITTRDLLFEDDNHKLLSELMTQDVVTAPPDTTLEQAEKILHTHRIEKLPLVDSKGKLTGLITLKDIMKISEYPKATKDLRGRLAVGAAVGVKSTEIKRVERLLEAGADCIVVDIAHGDSELEINIIASIRRQFPSAQVIGGNVATAEGTQRLIDAGVDAVKVGVGPGSICITRIVAGAGVPQLTAVMNCAAVARPRKFPSLRMEAFVPREILSRRSPRRFHGHDR